MAACLTRVACAGTLSWHHLVWVRAYMAVSVLPWCRCARAPPPPPSPPLRAVLAPHPRSTTAVRLEDSLFAGDVEAVSTRARSRPDAGAPGVQGNVEGGRLPCPAAPAPACTSQPSLLPLLSALGACHAPAPTEPALHPCPNRASLPRSPSLAPRLQLFLEVGHVARAYEVYLAHSAVRSGPLPPLSELQVRVRCGPQRAGA